MATAILSVSYDQNLLFTRELIFEQAGYSVTSAFGFTQAQAKCRTGGFDIMVLGHSIPFDDKIALIRHFREHCNAPVVSLLRPGEALVDEADHHASPENPARLLEAIIEIAPPERQTAA